MFLLLKSCTIYRMSKRSFMVKDRGLLLKPEEAFIFFYGRLRSLIVYTYQKLGGRQCQKKRKMEPVAIASFLKMDVLEEEEGFIYTHPNRV